MLKQEGTCREKKSEKKQESPAFKAGHNKVRRHLQKGENTMKRRDFMKLSAATALGATVAAMHPRLWLRQSWTRPTEICTLP